MKNRTTLRKNIVNILYKIFIYEESKIDYEIEDVIQSEMTDSDPFVSSCLKGVLKERETLISLANSYLVDWELKRLSKVDQAILLLAIYELEYTDTPRAVVINEAIELSKLYSDEKVVKMINGVLDSICHKDEKN